MFTLYLSFTKKLSILFAPKTNRRAPWTAHGVE